MASPGKSDRVAEFGIGLVVSIVADVRSSEVDDTGNQDARSLRIPGVTSASPRRDLTADLVRHP